MKMTLLTILPSLTITDDPLIRFNLYMSIGFVGVTLGLFAFILISRLRDGFRYTKQKNDELAIQSFLTAYIFEESTDEEAIASFAQQYVANKGRRQILIENIVSLHKNLIGESADKLQKLFKQLGLQKYCKHKLYSDSWHVVAKGIGELADMSIQKRSELIRTFVNHPNPTLRSEAQVALLKLNSDAPFSFLDDLKEPLLDWQQLQLARAAYKSQFLNIPNFEPWLKSPEESIVVFCLRMIAFYGQHSASAAILNLLEHASARVREEAVATLRQLEYFDAVPTLISMFNNQDTDIQLEILKTLPTIGDNHTLPFFEKVLGMDDRRLQLAAAKAMYRSGDQGQAMIKAIKNDPEHALQPLAAAAISYRV